MELLGISKLDLKRQNRMHILNTIKNKGPISRVDIAMLLELTRAAVTIITNEMIAQGILFEAGEAPNSTDRVQKGRKKILIDINRNYKFAFGACIERDMVSVGLSTLFGDVLDKKALKLEEGADFDVITNFINSSCETILKENYLELTNIVGIGIGVHPSMYSTMKIAEANDGLHCSELTSAVTKVIDLPISCGNSVTLLALANMEFKIDAASKRQHNVCMIQCGETFDAAIIKRNDCEEGISARTDIIENVIINNKPDRIGDGTVKNELTQQAMRKKLEKRCTEAQIVSLYNEMINRSAAGTLDEMLNNSCEKDDVHLIVKEAIQEFAMLLCNIYIAGIAEKIYINRFYLQNVDIEQMIQLIIKNSPIDMSNVIASSKFTGKFSFLGGCAYSVYRFFYRSGGLAYTENVTDRDLYNTVYIEDY